MTRTRGAHVAAVLAVAAVGGAITLSPAAGDERAERAVVGGAKGLKYVVEQKVITNSDPVHVVSCPGQTATIGGGTFLGAEDSRLNLLTNSTPQPAGDPSQEPDEGWLSEGVISPKLMGAQMLTYAICSKRPGKLRYSSEATLVDPESIESVTARCPRGTTPTGGGALTDSPLSEMLLVGSRPHPRKESGPKGWRATARNGGPDPNGLRVYAICSKQERKYSYRSKTKRIPDDDEPVAASRSARCPRGTAASGGGAAVIGAAFDEFPRLVSTAPKPAGPTTQTPKKGWFAEAASMGAPTLEVWAICKE